MSFSRALGRRRPVGVARSRLTHERRARRPREGRRLRLTPRARLAVLIAVVLAGLGFGAWFWLRDSSLVEVDNVTITGATGADAAAIRSALRSAARNMTTLDVQLSRLRTAVAPFPEVKRLRVRTAFPHRMVIEVIEERPVAVVDVAGREVPVAADGTLLRALTVTSQLPTIPLSVAPVGRRLTEARAGDAVKVLAAAPDQLLPKISQVATVAGHGPVVQLRSGPSIYFGDLSRLAAKWGAATAVLADTGSAGAVYIDVTDPSRPAAGAGPGSNSSGASATSAGTAASGAQSAAASSGGSAGSLGTGSGGVSSAGSGSGAAAGSGSSATPTGG